MIVLDVNGPAKPKITGNKIPFPVLDKLKPGKKVTYTVKVRALKAADVRFCVEVFAKEFGKRPVVEEESTRIFEKQNP